MAQDTTASIVMYQGNGSTTQFPVPMTKGQYGTISVAFVRRSNGTYTYNPNTFSLNSSNTYLTWTGTTLQTGDYICIVRTTSRGQPYSLPNNQKHIEGALDNLERQIQELQSAMDTALKVDPTYAIDPNMMSPSQMLDMLKNHVDARNNPHQVTKAQVGLGNVDNTSDLNKPISTATQAALDLKANSADLAAVATDGTMESLTDTDINNPVLGHFIRYDGTKWVNSSSDVTSVDWGEIEGSLSDQTDLKDALDSKVNIDGTSIMTGPLKMAAGSMRGAISPFLNGVAFWKMDSQNNITQIANLSDTQFHPVTTGGINLGAPSYKWKDLYLAGDEYLDNGKHIRFAGTASNRYFDVETNQDEIRFTHKYGSYDASLSFRAYTGDVVLYPQNDGKALFGLPTRRWQRIYATNLCSDTSGANLISIPNQAGTMALTSDIAIKSTEAQITSPANNQVLKYNGSKWVNATIQDLDNVISNCITVIPQDINIQSPSNNLVLQSGSKVYVPNGSGVYTPISMSADVSRSDFSAFGSGTYMVFYSQSYGGLIASNITTCVSGATDPSTATSHVWYDTTENKIKVYDNGSYTRTDLSFPICIMTNTYGTGVVSIDEIFNGLGYIGVTIFRTGIDYLIPNGFNSDGTLKNTTVSTTSCATYTVSSPTVNHRYTIAGDSNGSIALFYTNIEYNEKENLNYAGGTQTVWADLGSVIFTGSPARITSFYPKQTFHALDYYDFKYGNNTFFGTNTFTGLIRSESGSPKFEYKNTGMNIATSGGTSLGDTYIADARDTNDAQSGYIYNRMLTGTVSMKMGAVSKTTGSVKSSEVAATVENSGKRYIKATTPTKSDDTMDLSSNTNAVATTEWVKSYAMGLPDWSSQTTLTNGTTNTASKNGYVYGGSTSGDMAGHITVNGNDVFEVRTTHTGPSKGIVPVAKGDVITLPASGTYYFVPCKNL